MILYNIIKQLLENTSLYFALYNLRTRQRQLRELHQWIYHNKPLPVPHIVKQYYLLDHARYYNLHIFVETGTFAGDMVEAMKRHFTRLFSIELSKVLFLKAQQRFHKYRHIEIINGDSGKVLKDIVRRIDDPALFWLDGHYSAGITERGENDTPIIEELECIYSSPIPGHVIIIDDARCFGTDPAYPTLSELRNFINNRRNGVFIDVTDDSIRITPHKS